jgi:hypothetical protein
LRADPRRREVGAGARIDPPGTSRARSDGEGNVDVETPFASFAPLSESGAFAVVVALYLGLNLMTRLEADLRRADALFEQLGQLAALAAGS